MPVVFGLSALGLLKYGFSGALILTIVYAVVNFGLRALWDVLLELNIRHVIEQRGWDTGLHRLLDKMAPLISISGLLVSPRDIGRGHNYCVDNAREFARSG